jgi:hypothetical protein
MSGTFLAGLRRSGAVALGGNQRAAGTGHAHQARPGQQPTLARAGRAARWWERRAYALDAPVIAVRAGQWWDWRWVPTGCSPGSSPRTRPGDRTLDATARRRARAWEGARGQDSVAWDVGGGAGAPARPPLGSRGLPPHAPASWQGAWVSDTSSAQRSSAWRRDRSSGTPQSPWPYPSASAARNSRSRRTDSRRWPLSPPKDATVGGVEAATQAMPMHPRRQGRAHEYFSMAAAGMVGSVQVCALTPLYSQAHRTTKDTLPAKMLLRRIFVGKQAVALKTSSRSGCVQVSAHPKANDERLCW